MRNVTHVSKNETFFQYCVQVEQLILGSAVIKLISPDGKALAKFIMQLTDNFKY